jgi:FAD/FMN-containing dehydrogenase/Fe-S oxidoreductase
VIPDWQNELKERLEGEVYFDATTLGMYATDASAYQIFPKAVVVPRTEEDVVRIHKIAAKHRISLLPRGAGTSLAGQTVGDSIVLDFSKYLNRIIEFNEQEKWVRVEPGLIHSELNDYLKPYGLMYAPDPATSSRASIGGILANNSSGSRSIVFGKAIDHIREIRLLSADGEILTFRDIAPATVKDKCLQDDLEGRIYRTLSEVVDRDGVLIREKFPTVMRRVSGYSLDEFLGTGTWNLSKLICGSEGTLGTILEATLNLVDQPKFRGGSPIHYHNRLEAIAEVKNLLPFGPSAVELLDDRVISIAKSNPSTREMAQFIQGDPAALLIVEFFGDSEAGVREKFNRLNTYLMGEGFSYHAPFFMGNESTYKNIWEVRKKGLGLLFSMRGDEKPVTVIEDACVPVESLAAYVDDIVGKCNEFGIEVILYAHASVGVLHIRPLMNLRNEEDIRKFRELSEFSLQRVIEYKGSFSGEHGDGLSRSYGIPLFFGDQIYNDFKRIKSVFDPDYRMNPGKIVDAPAMDENLRYGSDFRDQAVKTLYHYRKELGFDKLIHMCNGIGLCHRVSGGVMCPSYKASLDEKDSTRGRANALRLTLSGQINRGDFTHEDLMDVLDLCISCKSCKTECPSNVDMAKLKSEVLQMHHDKKGISLRGWFIILSDDFSRWFSGPWAGWINGITRSRIFRIFLQWLARIDARRVLDPYARVSLKKWVRRRFVPKATGERVLLFADTYINYHQVEIGRAIVRILDSMDFQVELVDTGGSKRPLISNGFLRKARKQGTKIAERLRTELEKGTPVIVCEPSAYSALVEDIPDLIEDEQLGDRMREHIVSLEHFLAVFAGKQNREKVFNSNQKHHVIHGHCHQKAMEGTAFLSDIFDKTTGTYEIPDAGCCGMAGAFGFEKEHYDFSKQIFDTDLGMKLDDFPDDQLILASGFSCRHQIDELSVKKVKHWVEVLDYIPL